LTPKKRKFPVCASIAPGRSAKNKKLPVKRSRPGNTERECMNGSFA
jgi:hypothetical protein